MPLLNKTAARECLDQQQTQGAVGVTFADVDTAVAVVVIPANSYITEMSAGVTTAFNAVTTNTVDFSDGTTTLGTADTTAVGKADATFAATAALKVTETKTITATVKQTGGSLTAGAADIIVQWVKLPD